MELTLDRSWNLCLEMWKYVVDNLDDSSGKDSYFLKSEWLEKNGYGEDQIKLDCFFCHYAKSKGKILKATDKVGIYKCPTCPAALVSPRFNCESYNSYHWQFSPKKFYAKLLVLHKRYLKTL